MPSHQRPALIQLLAIEGVLGAEQTPTRNNPGLGIMARIMLDEQERLGFVDAAALIPATMVQSFATAQHCA